jgi:RHS repeat-associated protein
MAFLLRIRTSRSRVASQRIMAAMRFVTAGMGDGWRRHAPKDWIEGRAPRTVELDAVFGSDEDPVRFAARAEIGELMVLGERIYDPTVGRFLSPDPLFQIVNQFAYTLGNPVWFSDPNGTSPEANEAASGFDTLVGSLAVISAALGVLAVLLRFAPLPHLQAIAAVFGLIAALLGLLVALMLLFGKPNAKAVSRPTLQTQSGGGSGGTGGGGGGGGGFGGGGGGGCSPAQLTAVPRLGGWLPVLLPLQLLLGFLLLRRRRREESE